MAEVIEIPSRGFARGAVVRIKGEANNMLVIRGLETTTLVIVCESDNGGDARMREFPSRDLVQILPSAVPDKPVRTKTA